MDQIKHEYRDKLCREGGDRAHTGRVLEMESGQRWFHPDSGQPFRLKDASK